MVPPGVYAFLAGITFVAYGGVVLGTTFGPGDTMTPQQGPLFPYYATGLISYILISIALFIRTYLGLTGIEKLRMKYLFLGITVFVVPVCLFDIALPAAGFPYLNLIGPFASVGFVIATAYAIIRHQLMDIRVVIQRGTIYSFLISCLIVLYIAVLLSIDNLFDASTGIAASVSAAITILIGITTIPRMERFFRKVTDPIFFKDHYDYASALNELANILNEGIRLDELAPQLVWTLGSLLKPARLEFEHLSSGTTFLYFGCTLPAQRRARRLARSEDSDEKLRIPIVAHERTIGFLQFSAKCSGDPYTSEDRLLLRTFATQAAVALEKTRIYSQLEEYSWSLEDKVQERTKDITDMQQRQREFFDDISHAFQTPLTVIKNAMELLKNDPKDRDTLSFNYMEKSVDELSQLIRDVLQLARIDALPEEEAHEIVDVSSLVLEVIEYVDVICRQNRIRLSKDIEPQLIISGSRKQIQEVLVNLLSNSVRYMDGCSNKSIHVLVRHTEDRVEICITDTGVGIPEYLLPHIFDRFYRAHGSDTGHGLGLSIVKRIIDRHGGTISAESRPGKGATFIVRIPIARPLSSQANDAPE
ncbi:MAG: ATP-binding protein [Candidatus Pacebacteria bacterium]|nr:ATP-binding protein [Candidatus Paceibacterota bacterium]